VDGDPMKGEKASASKSEGYKIYAKKKVAAGVVIIFSIINSFN
jgi:hypothetical protein